MHFVAAAVTAQLFFVGVATQCPTAICPVHIAVPQARAKAKTEVARFRVRHLRDPTRCRYLGRTRQPRPVTRRTCCCRVKSRSGTLRDRDLTLLRKPCEGGPIPPRDERQVLATKGTWSGCACGRSVHLAFGPSDWSGLLRTEDSWRTRSLGPPSLGP